MAVYIKRDSAAGLRLEYRESADSNTAKPGIDLKKAILVSLWGAVHRPCFSKALQSECVTRGDNGGAGMPVLPEEDHETEACSHCGQLQISRVLYRELVTKLELSASRGEALAINKHSDPGKHLSSSLDLLEKLLLDRDS